MWKHKTFFNTSGDDYASAEENLVKFLNKENPEIISVTTSTSGYHYCKLFYKEREDKNKN